MNFSDKQLQRIREMENAHYFGLVGTYIIDYDKKIVYGDKTLCAMYGLDFYPDGIPLKDFLSNISPEDLKEANRLRDLQIDKDEAYEISYRVSLPNDKVRWVKARAKAFTVDGQLFYEGIVVDVTSGMEADLALKAQNKLVKTITDNTTSALIMMNDKGFCTFMNPSAEEMFGYTMEEINQKPLHYMIHHHYPDGREYPLEECPLDRALPQNFEMRAHEDLFFKKNGTSFPVICAASPIFENGIPLATVIEVRDITQQKASEELLKRNADHLSILNTIGISISESLDVQGVLQKVTDASTKLTGANFGAFFYNTISASGDASMLYTLSGASKEAFERFGMPRPTAIFHPTFVNEGVIRSDDITKDPRYGKNSPHQGMPSGHLPVVSYLAVSVVSKTGKVIGGLFFGHLSPGVFTAEHERLVLGIASQAAVALDNAKLYEEVNALNSKKDEFIGLASHELKTPLTSINGYLQILNRTETSAASQGFLSKTIKQVGKLSQLVADLLDVSKIQAGKLVLNLELFNFNDMLDDAIEMVTLSTVTHEIILTNCVEQQVYADRQRTEQVVINLLTNAIKYSPEGQKVVVDVLVDEGSLKVTVQDFGIGILFEQQEKIFSRFYRVDGLNPGMSGLGIGLYISTEIITRHHGQIGVESIHGQGSKFWFTIPLEFTPPAKT